MTVNNHPTARFDDVGWLTEAQMIEVDRVMIDDLHISLVQMMENAGRNLAQLVIDLYQPSSVTVFAGSGGNGGGGLVAARHLANRGVDVSITLGKPAEELTGVPSLQADILDRMGVTISPEPRRSEVVIDALIGYSLHGAPRGMVAELIESVAEIGDTVVSLDTPSGLDVTDGSAPGAVVAADATMTLALPKIGLRGSRHVGDLYLADISVPPAVYEAMDAGPPLVFGSQPVIRLVG